MSFLDCIEMMWDVEKMFMRNLGIGLWKVGVVF